MSRKEQQTALESKIIDLEQQIADLMKQSSELDTMQLTKTLE